jgi:hypothetical protein
MNALDRRFFVKTLLAAAASGVTPFVRSLEFAAAHPGIPADSSSVTLENAEQRLVVSPAGSQFSYQNFIKSGNDWKAATLPGTPLISGPSFPLLSKKIERHGSGLRSEGEGEAAAVDGSRLRYSWTSEVTAVDTRRGAPWWRFDTTLRLPSPAKLHEDTRVEPQIILWLSSGSTLMEGQSGSWRRVLLEQPTRNSLGTYGNDLPALYLLDQNIGVETMMFFDLSDMNWMSLENLPRFLVYRCSSTSRVRGDGDQDLGVGLIAQQATGSVLPAGDIRFTYYLLQRPQTQLLTEQQAATRWMQAMLPLFEEKLEWPSCATTWKAAAAGTVENLQDKAAAQLEIDGHLGLLSYVKNSSKLWTQSPGSFELMTVSDVLWPSLLYLQLHPQPAYQRECDALLADFPGFYHADTHTISNDYIRSADERADSWYPFENGLVKYPMIGALAGQKSLTQNFLDAFENQRKFAGDFNYLYPIYYHTATNQPEGAGTNYAIGGLYAWGAIIAHRLTGDQKYLDEARKSIRILHTVPSERLFHEPQELAYGALAAAELGMQEEAAYLLSQQLRLFYWYSDPSQKNHDIRGMVQACASILYPAFKENIEAILPWTGIFKRGIVWEGLLRFMDQQRRNNFYFFENCSDGGKNAPMSSIPYENLGTLELGGQTGNVGKEIYGSGESLWMYLMFEALGSVTDRELMLVNLDLLDAFDQKQFPPRELNFILYNPAPADKTATIAIPAAGSNKVRFTADSQPSAETLKIPARSSIRLRANY